MKLKDYLYIYEISRKDLAKASRVSTLYLAHIANGKLPSLTAAKRIEAATKGKVTTMELLGLAPSPVYFPLKEEEKLEEAKNLEEKTL